MQLSNSVGCPRCEGVVVTVEFQHFGNKTQVMDTCDKCGHRWFNDIYPRRYKMIGMKEGKCLAIVGFPE